MNRYKRMPRYPVGTHIEQNTGYVKVKVAPGKWQGLGAHLLTKAGVKVGEGDRVFFADGDRLNRHVSNLRRIHFNRLKFVQLKSPSPFYKCSWPIYVPDAKEKPMKESQRFLKVA